MTTHTLDATERTRTTVVGQRRVQITPERLDAGEVPVDERSIEYECLTAGRIEGEWRGVPVGALVTTAEAPPETTHLLVQAADGLQACVPIDRALAGILALERGERRLAAPRFVAPGIEGPRAVKTVEWIEAVSLSPGEDREAYEDLSPAAETDNDTTRN